MFASACSSFYKWERELVTSAEYVYDESKFEKTVYTVKNTMSLIHNLTCTQNVENLSDCAAVTYTECRKLV